MSIATPATQQTTCYTKTHPHFCSLNLPLISVTFISSPFGLKEVENARERVVLTTLRGQGNFGLLRALLLLGRLGLLLLLPRGHERPRELRNRLGLRLEAQHPLRLLSLHLHLQDSPNLDLIVHVRRRRRPPSRPPCFLAFFPPPSRHPAVQDHSVSISASLHLLSPAQVSIANWQP